MTRFTVILAFVFATERVTEDKYDVWDIHIPIEADGPLKAFLNAISRSKKFEEWKVLGYPDPPVICGVRAVHDATYLADVSEEEYLGSRLPILVGTIDELKVRLLGSFESINIPYGFIHIDGQS